VEKIFKTLAVDQKDIRKGDWTNKEASTQFSIRQHDPMPYMMTKSFKLELTQLVEGGSNAPLP